MCPSPPTARTLPSICLSCHHLNTLSKAKWENKEEMQVVNSGLLGCWLYTSRSLLLRIREGNSGRNREQRSSLPPHLTPVPSGAGPVLYSAELSEGETKTNSIKNSPSSNSLYASPLNYTFFISQTTDKGGEKVLKRPQFRNTSTYKKRRLQETKKLKSVIKEHSPHSSDH